MVEPGASQSVRGDSAQLARREQARELGAGLVLAIYRLLKIGQIHSVDNMAVVAQLEQTVDTIRLFTSRTEGRVSLLFAKSTVFVAGQLLKGSRSDYEAATDLGEMLRRFELSEIIFGADVDVTDLRAFLLAFVAATQDPQASDNLRQPSENIRLRYVSPAALEADTEETTPEEDIARAYGSAIVVMRHLFENLSGGKYQLPHEAKRIAQKLVRLSEGDTPAFLGVTAMRNANHDAAGRAVNTSILAVTMTRQLTGELQVLARVAMAALLYDVGKPVILEAGAMDGHSELLIQHLNEEDETRLPAATVVALTAMGKLHEASRVRSVMVFEAHWHRLASRLGPLYQGARHPAVAARIVSTAHRFNELLTPDPAASRFVTPDEAVRTIIAEAKDDYDRAVAALLIGAVGIFPTGTIVELNTGERGVVVKTPVHPAQYVNPLVRLVYDESGEPTDGAEVDLANDETRTIAKVLTESDGRLDAVCRIVLDNAEAPSPPSGHQGAATTAPPPRQRLSDMMPATLPPTMPPKAGAPPSVVPVPVDGAQEIPRDIAPRPEAAGPPSSRRSAPRVITETVSGSLKAGSTSGSIPREDPATATMAAADNVESTPPEADDSVAPSGPAEPEEAPSSRTDVESAEQEAPSVIRSLVPKDVAPTATGSLRRTPAAHVFVYVLENELTGTLVFNQPDAECSTVFLDAGAPVRIWTSKRVAPLRTMLLAMGCLLESAFKSGRLAEIAEDDVALEAEVAASDEVDDDDLADTLAEQLRQRIAYVFALPPETTYEFYADRNLIADRTGNIRIEVSPLAVLATGIRDGGDDPRVDATLATLEDHAIRLHAHADLDGFDFVDAELAVIADIRQRAITFGELIAKHDASVVEPALYALMVTRCLDIGSEAPPPVRSLGSSNAAPGDDE